MFVTVQLKLCKVKLGDNIFPQSPFLFITGISSQFFFFFFLIRGFRQSLVNNVWESPVITFQPRVAHATKLSQISVRFSFNVQTDLLSYKLSIWRKTRKIKLGIKKNVRYIKHVAGYKIYSYTSPTKIKQHSINLVTNARTTSWINKEI